ncbi:MAG: structural protein P5 [Bacteroidaceae bacterium]|jgi:hypothetical protein|nr:structural protein P5 [Bacteroidaceae bacterium]
MKEPRGMRNCNPLNIRKTSERKVWQGQIMNVKEKDFCTFATPAYGYRAAWILLDNYQLWMVQHGKSYCLRNIISRWAPASENDTRTYISRVSKLTNIDPDELLKAPFLDTQRFVEIIAAMTCVENGISMNQVPVEYIREGFRLAFGKINEV